MTMSEDKKNGKQNKTVKPFDPMTLRGVTVRNRIWLPPMDTYSALAQDGKPTPFLPGATIHTLQFRP